MTDQIYDCALQWAADRAGLPYEWFVDGLTETTKQRILTAYHNRYVDDAPVRSVEDKETNIHSRIRDAFRRGKAKLPQEIRPGAYQAFLDSIDVHSKQENQILASVVREELKEANLAVNRRKLNHFLWWLGGEQ